MTPQRARELWNHQTTARSPLGSSITGQTLTIGNIRKHMTQDEIEFVTEFWHHLPGSSSFASALLRIANEEAINQ